MVQSISDTSVACQHSCLTIPYPSIFKCTKTEFGDKDEHKTNISHQTVIFTFFLINSCLPCILISLFIYCGAIFYFFSRETHCSKHGVIT